MGMINDSERGLGVVSLLGDHECFACFSVGKVADGIPVFGTKREAKEYFQKLKKIAVKGLAEPRRIAPVIVSFEEAASGDKNYGEIRGEKVLSQFVGWGIDMEMGGGEQTFSCQPYGDRSTVYHLFQSRAEARNHAKKLKKSPRVIKATPVRIMISVLEVD